MRASVRSDYPSDIPAIEALALEVYVDGQRLEHCFAADTDRGVAWVYDHAAAERGDKVPVRQIHGHVELLGSKASVGREA